MNEFNFQEFEGLAETGFENQEPVKPEDEFFHAAYIAGQTRQNHVGINEEAGKLQIRGVEYNVPGINMIITHVKKVLTNTDPNAQGRNQTRCFSFKEGNPPWFGTSVIADGSNRKCGQNSAERATDQFCKDCREQIIVAGIYCNDDGTPILNDEKKPTFLFIRGKGMKYDNVSTYLGNLFKEDMEPIFSPVTAESKKFEKIAVNNKRFVTVIGMGKANSAYGMKDVFTLTKGTKLANQTVVDILKITKKTKDKFNEKFNWSSRATQGASDYAPPAAAPPASDQIIPDSNPTPNAAAPQQEKAPDPGAGGAPAGQQFNFEDLNF